LAARRHYRETRSNKSGSDSIEVGSNDRLEKSGTPKPIVQRPWQIGCRQKPNVSSA
jgi:hypothetical protein